MILPQTYTFVLILMAISLFCWGSWANTFKLAGKFRFELYYFDFALGFMLMAILLAFTVGSMGFDGFSFVDDLEHAGKREWLYGFVAGVIFGLGNMLITSAISVGGMAIAYVAGAGMAVILSSLLMYKAGGSFAIVLSGCAVILAAIVIAAIAYNILGQIRHEVRARAGKSRSTKRPTSVKAIVLAVIGGLLVGSFYPLVPRAMEGEIGLGPYSLGVMFAIGVVAATLVFSIFFMNLPVEGEPVEFVHYFQASPWHHLLGLLGGILWCGGLVASLTAAAAPAGVQLSPMMESSLSNGYPLLAILWGLLAWKEFREGDARVKLSGLMMLILLAGGVALIAVAQLYLPKAA